MQGCEAHSTPKSRHSPNAVKVVEGHIVRLHPHPLQERRLCERVQGPWLLEHIVEKDGREPSHRLITKAIDLLDDLWIQRQLCTANEVVEIGLLRRQAIRLIRELFVCHVLILAPRETSLPKGIHPSSIELNSQQEEHYAPTSLHDEPETNAADIARLRT